MKLEWGEYLLSARWRGSIEIQSKGISNHIQAICINVDGVVTWDGDMQTFNIRVGRHVSEPSSITTSSSCASTI